MNRRTIIAFAALFLAACNSSEPQVEEKVSEPVASGAGTSQMAVIETVHGDITIRFRPDLAPNHVERIKTLASQGFYDGVVFHRVIEGFMAQTGDPTGTGTGSSDLPDLKAEFSDARFTRGTLGMARSSNPDSANSQFFIMLADGEFLNGEYTVFGEVVGGMDVVDAIKKGDKSANGKVENPDKILKMRLEPASG